MRLRPAACFLPSLALLLLLRAGSAGKASPPPISVIQTPPFLNVEEGSTLSMECRVEGVSTEELWFIAWRKMSHTQMQLENSSKICFIVNEANISSTLTITAAELVDSGKYLCSFGSTNRTQVSSNGTQVIISEITDFEVSQTPEHVEKEEGTNVTMECRFRTVGNTSTMFVKWSRDGAGGELTNQEGSRVLSQDLEKGLASLTLLDARVDDSGSYKCEVENSARNRSGSGPRSHVVIKAAKLSVQQSPASIQGREGDNLTLSCRVVGASYPRCQHSVTWYKDGTAVGTGECLPGSGQVTFSLRNVRMRDAGFYWCNFANRGQGNRTRVTVLERKNEPVTNRHGGGVGVAIGAGIGAAILFLLLLLSILVWRCKKKAKETPAGTENELQKHPPLTTKESDVTYAHLRFNKREVQPESEVVYAEVKKGPRH
ncbi:carcinoembryonic antigen-related cell adhesion molecule 1-like isoform X1 [Varanus komodoensis]|uniref:carcinoembryonic antigen-related cell adhesion molecule 1-like isoform X1 n=1 Tax=Varanus komodoensis TaxID=61221 RepID=UPI001CF7EB54|nr:carcinoembryonic antigen-related cell adhesion molecule 1-like isoform X1 [Varanus komodoensis]